jgi:hypothetical protein
MIALVAELRNKEAAHHLALQGGIPRCSDALIDICDSHFPVGPDNVAFHPGPEIEGIERHRVFFLAGLNTPPTANALVHLNAHPESFLYNAGFFGRRPELDRQRTEGNGHH